MQILGLLIQTAPGPRGEILDGYLLTILEVGESGYSLSTSIGERSIGPLRRKLLLFILPMARAENRMKSASFV